MKKTTFLLLMTVGILLFCAGCKSNKPVIPDKNNTVEQPAKKATMPQGRLMHVMYKYSGMARMPYSNFNLIRTDSGKSSFSFWHGSEMSFENIPDSLFDALRRVIEEEHMYEYESYYGLPRELEQGMLDGYSWSFDAVFENKERISSSGRHVSPDGKGLRKIEDLLVKAAQSYTKDNEEW